MDLRSKIILIYGPTASGKSKFAIRLAKKINGEIVNADSMQIYKEFKLISARPVLCPKIYSQNKLLYKKLLEELLNIFSVAKLNIEIALFSKSLSKTDFANCSLELKIIFPDLFFIFEIINAPKFAALVLKPL